MKLKITEAGVRKPDGGVYDVGDIVSVDVKEIPASLVNKAVEFGDGHTFVTNPAEQKTDIKGPFTVGEVTSGWAPILDGDGNKVKSLRKADAEAFGTLTADEQLAFLSE